MEARSGHRQSGAFYAGISVEGSRCNSVFTAGEGNRRKFLDWLERLSPNGLIISTLQVVPWLADAGWKGLWVANTGLPIQDESCAGYWLDDYATLGGVAARHLIDGARSGVRGAPEHPTVTLVQGRIETTSV